MGASDDVALETHATGVKTTLTTNRIQKIVFFSPSCLAPAAI